MSKCIIYFVIFFLLGAIINVVVAWSWILFVPTGPWNASMVDELKAPLPQHVVINPNLDGFIESEITNRGSYQLYVSGIGFDSKGNGPAVLLYSRIESGWPFPTLAGTKFMTANGLETSFLFVIEPTTSPYRFRFNTLPLRLMWPGFVINTGFYGGIIWLLFCGPFVLRRRRRCKRNQCVQCGYPKGESDVCSECGSPLLANK